MERNERFGLAVTACLVALGLSVLAQARIVYVDDDANGLNNGSSWIDAYRNLQDALADVDAASGASEIRAAGGLYRPDQGRLSISGNKLSTFKLTGSLTLKGGYAGNRSPDPNERDASRYITTLSGDLMQNDLETVSGEAARPLYPWVDNVETVVRIVDANLTMDGFHVTGGHYSSIVRASTNGPWGGGGMSLARSNASLSNCSFSDNDAATASGGGVLIGERCLVTITNSVFRSNHALSGGGGLCNGGIDVILERCVFSQNRTEWRGGAIENRGGRMNITSCEFVGNSCLPANEYGYGGAIYGSAVVCGSLLMNNTAAIGGGVSGGTGNPLEFQNSLFIANTATQWGGAIAARSARLLNCTVVGNRAPTDAVLQGLGPIEVRDCIIWKNESTSPQDPITSNRVGDCSFCCIDGVDDALLAAGNISANPAFVQLGHWDPNATPDDPNDDFWVSGDYHLKSQAGRWDPNSQNWVMDEVTSPCIDAGDPNSPVGDEPFPNGGRINMGAYGGSAEASKSYFSQP